MFVLIQLFLQGSLEWSTRPHISPHYKCISSLSSASRARPAPASGISYMLFPLPEAPFQHTCAQLTPPMAESLFKCPLLSEASSHHSIQNANPPPHAGTPSPSSLFYTFSKHFSLFDKLSILLLYLLPIAPPLECTLHNRKYFCLIFRWILIG